MLVYAKYQQARAQTVMTNWATAEKLWDDSNFESMKMDQYFRDINESLELDIISPRHVWLWKEQWETHTKATSDDERGLKARLEKKYGGLKLYNMDYDSRQMTCLKPFFHKKRGENRYCIFAVLGGYDPKKDNLEEGNYDMWNSWDLDSALYDFIRDCYTANPGVDRVVLHEQNTGVLSDHGEDI